MEKQVKWKARVEHVMACNCNWGCPCSFDAPPTNGSCEAADVTRINRGNYGDITLNGLRWVFVGKWPGPLHEKNGQGIVYLDPSTKGPRRDALEAIAAGKAGGPIGILMSTVTAGLEVRTAPIECKFAGKNSYFRVGDEVRVGFEPIRNPVTNEEHHATLKLATGLLTKSEEFYSSKEFNVNTPSLKFSHPGHNALTFKSTWKGP